jgi:hypothetical protein
VREPDFRCRTSILLSQVAITNPDVCTRISSRLDEHLLELIRAREARGLGALFDLHGAACLRAATQAGSEADAQAVVCEVFLATWRMPPLPAVPMRDFLVTRTLARAREVAKELTQAD